MELKGGQNVENHMAYRDLVVDGMASDGETENTVDECQNTTVENNQARD